MKTASFRKYRWSIVAAIALTLMLVSIPLFHGTVLARGGHEVMGFSHGGERFIRGGEYPGRVIVIGQAERAGHGFPLVSLLLKSGILLIGLALFAKGKSFVKWGGGILAVLALGSLFSFWLVLLAAVVMGAYWLMRRRSKSQPQVVQGASADWLNPYHAASNTHILDQWEQQIRKEAKE